MIKYIDYGSSSLDTEINNYLYYLNEVCADKKDVRRYVTSIIRLYDKLNSLPVNYSNEELESNRTLRKSSRYINKIKKFVKKIKSVDSSVFIEAANKLCDKNGESLEAYRNRYSKENWDSEQISRTLTGDISGIVKRKRRDVLSSVHDDLINSSDTVYFDDLKNIDNDDTEVLDIKNDNFSDNGSEISFDSPIEEDINQNEEVEIENDYSSDYVERNLIKKELIELKKEIDQNEDLFIDIDHINPEQRSVIKSYMSICEKYNNLNQVFHFIYNDASSTDIVNIYEKIYDFTGFLISEMFEHIIHLSKISCDISNKTGLYEEKYMLDRSVIDVFGKYDIFIAKLQNYVKLLNEKQGDNISSTDKEMLSKLLWDKYRLYDINPSSIKEAVSLDLMSFINENPFTLVQTISSSKRNNESYKKYDLDKIMENVDFSLEKYIPELFNSIKTKINNDAFLSNDNKEYAISNIIFSFSKFIGEIHGLTEYPDVAHDYLVSYIMNKVFSVPEDLDGMLKDCINDIYIEENKKYKSLGFFEKIMYSKGKPNVSTIENKIKDFTQKIDNISFSVE